MSQQEILRNIYTFLQILEASRTVEIAQWDNEALQNALKWAEWCEIVFIKAKGKTYEQELDAEIAKLNHLPWSLGTSVINLDCLRESRQHLIISLLENSYMAPALYSFFIDNCLHVNNATKTQSFIKTCAKLACHKAAVEISTDLLQDIQCDNKSCDILRGTYALHLLKFLTNALEKTRPTSMPRTVQLLRKKLQKKLETNEDGWDFLITCLHIEGDHFPAQCFILDFIKDYIASLSDCETSRLFSSLDKNDLCILAKNSSDLLSMICSWLRFEGCAMTPCLEYGKLSWRNTVKDGLTYSSLLDIVLELWLCDYNRTIIHEKLLSHQTASYCVWHSLERQLH